MIALKKYLIRKNIIIICFVIFIIGISFLLFDILRFRLKDTTPSIDRVASSSIEIKYYFSQPIKSVDQVLLDGDIIYDATIENSTITIPFKKSLVENVKYSIELKSIRSKWFNNRINSISQNFSPQYINFDELSSKEKKMQVDASHSGQVDDPFISDNSFPIFNERWQIDATVIKDTRSVVLGVKFFSEVPDYDNGGTVKQVSNETAEKYRLEVLSEIKKRGADPESYTIIYSNKYLYEKYGNHATH